MELLFIDDSTVSLKSDTGELLSWNTTILDRTDFRKNANLFRDINGYFNHLPASSRFQIWTIYQKIHKTFEDVYERQRLAAQLIELVKELYEVITLEGIEWYVGVHSNVKFPPDSTLLTVHDRYDPNPGRTYLKRDYYQIIYMMIALRPMIPIWGEYMRLAKNDSGTEYKEYAAMRLLSQSKLMVSEPMERLLLYVETSIRVGAQQSNAHIISGLGSEETAEWLLAMVAIRRVSVGEIDASETSGNIITNIYGFVTNTLKDFDRKFGGSIRDKNPEDASSDEEGSIMESYKVKQDLSAGDVELYSVYTEDALRMAVRTEPTLDVTKFERCLSHIQPDMDIQKHHLTLTQWVMQFVLPPTAIPCLTKPALLRTIAAAQSVLWEWGFVDIAALMTASPTPYDEDEAMSIDGRARIPTDLMEHLMRLYPHLDQSDKNSTSDRKNNYASQAIAALTKELTHHTWNYCAPMEIIAQCQNVDSQMMALAPPNIMEQLARLVIKLAEKDNE